MKQKGNINSLIYIMMIRGIEDMKKFLEKIILSEKDYEYLTKGIAAGVGIGIIVGVITEEIVLFFALGGVTGILAASIISIIKKSKGNVEV